MKIYLIFYISLLQLLKSKLLIYKVLPLSFIIINNSNSSYFINSIDDMRWKIQSKRFKLLVKWKGYEMTEATWQSKEDLEEPEVAEEVEKFERLQTE